MYDLPILHHIPHRDYPTPYYQRILQIPKEYKITLEELIKGKLKQIYYQISYPKKRPTHQETFRWKLVTSSILPNYLKTFNYRTVRHLLPFSLEPGECTLCLQLQDTAVHIFAKCSITRQTGPSFKKFLTISPKHLFHSIALHPLISTSRENLNSLQNQLPSS